MIERIIEGIKEIAPDVISIKDIKVDNPKSIQECKAFWDEMIDKVLSKGEGRLDKEMQKSFVDIETEPTGKYGFIEKQDQAIHEVESGKRELQTALEKGNYGEMKVDQDLRKRGYERISKDVIMDVSDQGHRGIDGIYYNPNGNPKFLIVDAKYGSSQLSDTADGKQMSDSWVDKRIDESVGKEKADEIRVEVLFNPENVGKYIGHVDENGVVSYDKLDSEGNIYQKDVKI